MHRDRDGEPDDVRDDTDANHDQRLNDGWGPGASDGQVRHEAQRSDQSTEGTTDSDQQDRQRGQDSQDDRYRGPGPMLCAVDLYRRVRVGERAAYSGFDRTTGRCRQRVLALTRPGGRHSANGDGRAAPEGVGSNNNRAGYAVDADRFRFHLRDLKKRAQPRLPRLVGGLARSP
jgi:hypothetical protein